MDDAGPSVIPETSPSTPLRAEPRESSASGSDSARAAADTAADPRPAQTGRAGLAGVPQILPRLVSRRIVPAGTRRSLGLSRRLFLIATLTVLAVEGVIFFPSAANFRWNFISERTRLAQVAALSLELAQERTEELEGARRLIENQRIESIRLRRSGDYSVALLHQQRTPRALVRAHLDGYNPFANMWAVADALVAPRGRAIFVDAPSMLRPNETVEVVLDEAPLKAALAQYAWRILGLSLVIAISTGFAVFFILSRVFVRPMAQLIDAIHYFRAHPEDASRKFLITGRKDEIWAAKEALEAMQADVRQALKANERLAQLGAAVAKINHDLRNSLASAQILSERLVSSEDPKVRQIAPRIERALERAINLTQATLKFGKTEERSPDFRIVSAAAVVEGAAAEALVGHPEMRWTNAVDPGLRVRADPENLHRIVGNLVRNAAQALAAQGGREDPGQISVQAEIVDNQAFIRICDDGPGIPERVREKLFAPFSGGGRVDSTGLGLAIARELARAQGGDVKLESTGPEGSVFCMCLPLVPVPSNGRARG